MSSNTPRNGGTNTPARELRTIRAAHPLELRTVDGKQQVSGYAVVFNSESLDLGGFTEICAPGMFTRTLRENPDVLALRDHKQELLLGRTTAQTLTLRTDSKGLAFTLNLPNSPVGEDAAEAVRLKNLTGVSFGFATVQNGDDWAVTADGKVIRTLLDVDLFEISITSFPAYQATSVRTAPKELRSKLTVSKSDAADGAEITPDGTSEVRNSYDEDLDGYEDGPCGDDPDSDECEDWLEENRSACPCECAECKEDRCEACSDPECDADNCEGCPFVNDDTRSDGLRFRQLFTSLRASKVTTN